MPRARDLAAGGHHLERLGEAGLGAHAVDHQLHAVGELAAVEHVVGHETIAELLHPFPELVRLRRELFQGLGQAVAHGHFASAQRAQAFRVVAKDRGAYTHAIGGMPDHIHVAVSIPPTITVSEYVGRLKGGSSRLIGKSIADPDMETFLWQSQYGVLTFGERALPEVIAYIENQPRHHANGSLWRSFEQLQTPIQPQR